MQGRCAKLVLDVEVREAAGGEHLEELFAVGGISTGAEKMVCWSGPRGVDVVNVNAMRKKEAGDGGVATVEGAGEKLSR